MGSLAVIPSITSLPALAALPSVQNANTELAQNDAPPNLLFYNPSNTGLATLGAPIPSTPTAPATTPASSPPTSGGSKAAQTAASIAGNVGSILTGGLLTPRYIYLILGLLLIGAGIYSFKTTQTIIQTGTKVAKGTAALLAP